MEKIFKRYFFVIPIATVLICSTLAAKAVAHWIEGSYLGDRADTPPIPKILGTPAKKDANKKISKSGEPLVDRNIFCSECLPPEPEEIVTSDASDVPLTSLPLRLVATNVASRPEYSFATVRNDTSEKQGAYWIDDVIPDAGKVVSIGGKNVVFRNDAAKRLERISLLDRTKAKPAPAKDTPKRKPRNKREELLAEIDAGIKKVNDTSYEIDRSVVDKVLANPMAVARGARVVPSIKNGKNNGFKLYAIRPSSAYAKIGLMNGDTIHSVNGFDLTTADKALEVYQKVKESSNLSVSVTRRGKPVTMTYTIR